MKNTLMPFVLLVTIQCFTVSCLNIAHVDDNNAVKVASEEQSLSISCANNNGNIEAIQKNKFHKPDFLRRYEESQWGDACWNLSLLVGFPAVALLVVPGCELWGYMHNNEDHFFINPQKSYMVNPYTRYLSDKFIIEPVYCILSIPTIFLKFLCDW